MAGESELRVLIADDHPLILTGIHEALARIPGVTVVAEARDGNEALDAIGQHRPDLVILDIKMGGLPSDQVIVQGTRLCSGLKTLILSAFGEENYVRRFCGLAVQGFMLKDEAPESLSQAVRVIGQGGTWFSRTVADQLLTLQRHPVLFSERELELIGLLLAGGNNRLLAEHLRLSRQTVSKLLCVIYQKMGVSNRIQSIVWIQENRSRWQRPVHLGSRE